MKRPVFTILCLLLVANIFAQKDTINWNYIANKSLKTVKMHTAGIVVSYPMIDLTTGQLTFSFDDMESDAKNYIYTIVHCNADWKPSDLTDLEYIDGFTENQIEDYEFSFNTITDYTHYELTLPNDDMKFKVSGNYLLKVYEDEDEKELVIVRRFMVVEPLMNILPQIKLPSQPSKSDTHHEIDFTISHKGIKVRNTQSDVKVVIMQNGRWDNAITGIKPFIARQDQLIYDFQDKILFPAGKEFRYIDLRTFRFRTDRMADIVEYDDTFEVTVQNDLKRQFMPYLFRIDINGKFVIENMEELNGPTGGGIQIGTTNTNFANERRDNRVHDLRGDYAFAIFTLEAKREFHDADVYLFGGFTDWQIKEEFKMEFNPETRYYTGETQLKQGYHEYLYAVVPKDKKKQKIDFSETEGDWYETENDYTILAYFRPFGTRYDKLVAAYTFNSGSYRR